MGSIHDESFEIRLQDVLLKPQEEEYYPVKLVTSRDSTYCRYYPVKDADKAVIWVGGVGGEWDTPAPGLYPRLCQDMRSGTIASLRIRHLYPTQLVNSILDVLIGLAFLRVRVSNGGAVVIQPAAKSPKVYTVVTLATQAYSINAAPKLATRCSLLLVHSMADQLVPPSCSQYVYQHALQPKHIILYPNTNHGLDEVADEVHHLVQNWIVQHLNRAVTTLI
ncbi:alpha/beta hydrolase family protein [Umezakia ovalisporum]|uniref:alpha/beta hydrolase family protein n=1 Tax=Umezakia ovalisporum TaxID=75695 RepID=UPI0035BB6F71